MPQVETGGELTELVLADMHLDGEYKFVSAGNHSGEIPTDSSSISNGPWTVTNHSRGYSAEKYATLIKEPSSLDGGFSARVQVKHSEGVINKVALCHDFIVAENQLYKISAYLNPLIAPENDLSYLLVARAGYGLGNYSANCLNTLDSFSTSDILVSVDANSGMSTGSWLKGEKLFNTGVGGGHLTFLAVLSGSNFTLGDFAFDWLSVSQLIPSTPTPTFTDTPLPTDTPLATDTPLPTETFTLTETIPPTETFKTPTSTYSSSPTPTSVVTVAAIPPTSTFVPPETTPIPPTVIKTTLPVTASLIQIPKSPTTTATKTVTPVSTLLPTPAPTLTTQQKIIGGIAIATGTAATVGLVFLLVNLSKLASLVSQIVGRFLPKIKVYQKQGLIEKIFEFLKDLFKK
jgi:hypothetical protein